MKWLIWASFFPPHVGGYEKNVFELAKRLVASGEEVWVITCKTDDLQGYFKVMQGVKVYRLPCWKLLNGTFPVPKPSPALWKLMAARPDVESTQTRFFPLSFIGAVHAWGHHIPLIHTERGTQHSAVSNRVVDLISRVYDHTIGRWIVRRGTSIGVSTAACEFLKHLGAKNPIRIPNGIAYEDVQRIETLEPIILFVGRLIWAKGVQDLIEAVKDIPCRLEIAGDGPYRKELEKLGKGVFLGNVENVSELHSRAAVFVNPSYSEGLPTSVMEAAMYGTPIVATDVGGTREIIEGILVKPHDVEELRKSILWVLKNKGKAREMALKAQIRMRTEYAWEKVVASYIALCE
jgi:glycosyltransferase involved in cell wall biosynthesis